MKYAHIPLGRTKILNRATQYDTIKAMRRSAHFSAKDPYFKAFVKENRLTKKDLPNLYRSLHSFLDFERDPTGTQVIKTAKRTLKDRTGNCVDYSVLLGAFLINMGIPFYFRMVTYSGPSKFSHIYVLLNDGTPIDLVMGKDGPRIPPIYGFEVPHNGAFDLKIN